MDQLPCADMGLREGEPFYVGSIAIWPLFTPGHTATHHCYRVEDGAHTLLFSGDALLIDACGRTDFQGGNAAALYRSIHEKLFVLADEIGAPLGAALGAKLPTTLLLSGFAVLMLLVAARLWRQAVRQPAETVVVRAGESAPDARAGAACRMTPAEGLLLTSRCTLVLGFSGFATGLLSGLFGVGGGFLIVPMLVLAASLPMHRAVATSLLVIAIISAAGTASHLVAGHTLNLKVTGLFVVGGLAGMALGATLSRRLAGPLLQKLFASAMIAVALFMLARMGL